MKSIERVASALILAAADAHILHLKSKNYAEHMALGELYEKLPGLTDKFIEAYQAQGDIIQDYSHYYNELKVLIDPLSSIEGWRDAIVDEDLSDDISDATQSLLDDIINLFDITIYKLKHLK